MTKKEIFLLLGGVCIGIALTIIADFDTIRDQCNLYQIPPGGYIENIQHTGLCKWAYYSQKKLTAKTKIGCGDTITEAIESAIPFEDAIRRLRESNETP